MLKQILNEKIVDILDLNRTEGDVGIEVEMELRRPLNGLEMFDGAWRIEHDGSLKVNGNEFVLKKPIIFSSVTETLDTLKSCLAHNKVSILPSIRAGVHVHLNMQQSTLKQVFNFLACYYPMETALTRFCGNGREGNLFCLRARDANGVIQTLEQVMKTGDIAYLDTDDLRYSALNLRSLFNYGTLEFRALATTPDLGLIPIWCQMIEKIKEYSEGIPVAWEPLSSISGDGGETWMRGIFGDELFAKLAYDGLEDDIIRDSRNVQYLISLMEGLDK